MCGTLGDIGEEMKNPARKWIAYKTRPPSQTKAMVLQPSLSSALISSSTFRNLPGNLYK
jgi:hypothetical protein